MKRSTIWILTVVMAIALLGLLAMQIFYLEKMVAMRNSQFNEIVKRSLYSVSTMLEQNETKYFLDQDLAEAEQYYSDISKNSFNFNERHEANIDTTLTTEDPASLRPANRNTLKDLNDSYQLKQEILKKQYLYQKTLLNEVILTILNESSDRPIQERADSATVATYLRSELEYNGLELPFEFAIVNRSSGVVYKTEGYSPLSQQDVYSQLLFPNDPKSKQNMLNITFPNKSDYIFSSVKFLVPSLAFTFLLLGVFLYTISVAFKQKKLSEIKNDFINNMTHEFKTPISSISIAAQMLNDDSVRKSPEMLKHVSTVINDETKRLRFQVEKVLQLSLFDRKNATMRLEEEDANANIYNVINTFKLKVEKYGGRIDANLDAEDPIIKVDRMHFTNVIFNLLDNAVKYRREDVPPELTVTTVNPDEDHIQITVADNGIGMKREDLKKIFEKFYRVSTGNLHDVKGFGLGLAYVHKMIDLFGGTIRAESEVNKGSKFIITLPLYK
ncbi:MAG: HAMP domain-containing histidine kinase [Muribaculaceae bacterium]|nr:HAMP domain-containing histidine kinase [Muribaculaceae bacterium]MBR5685363.1 HAMP domain-containing histidine kinase [Muribaculaceae bacterium]